MSSPAVPGVRPWLVIEASAQGRLRFALVEPSLRPRIASVHELSIEGIPTFTDALQQFERNRKVSVGGLNCALAIAGAASGETISLVRSRWTISRTGLHAFFGTPPFILNDVAARAWATRSGSANIATLRGIGAPAFDHAGRYGMIMIEEGVGAAIVDLDRDAGVRVLETEAGHMDFQPVTAAEERLAKAVRGPCATTTWEMILMLERFDARWATACPELAERERQAFQSALLGRFAVNLIHAFGAWDGIMFTGTRAARMLEGANRSSFDAAFTTRRNFGRLIMAAHAWRVDQHEAVLAGAAERLAHEFRPALSAAA
ncbi:MAG TPA: glucokinase [Sphingomicrobium sp.]|nr:glucokinase [Sphingomicrobium sp.]